MKKMTLCFVVILLFAITVFSQTGRKFTATAMYLSSINGNTGGEIKLKINGKIQNFVWDRDEGTGKLPIFESNPKGFQQGAEWKIVYSKYDSDASYFFLWNATFTGRVLTETNSSINQIVNNFSSLPSPIKDDILRQLNNLKRTGWNLPISEEELRNEYNKMPEERKRGVLAQEIVLQIPKTSLEGQILEKATQLVNKLRKDGTIVSELAFAELAKSYSEKPSTASSGGKIGGLVRKNPNNPDDPLQRLLNMKPGEITEPIKYGNAYWIFRRGEDVWKSFEDLKEELKVSLGNRRAYSIADKSVQQIINNLQVILIDLNGDGASEWKITGKGELCYDEFCYCWIYRKVRNVYQEILTSSFRNDVLPTNTKTNGYFNLKSDLAVLKFDGRRYQYLIVKPNDSRILTENELTVIGYIDFFEAIDRGCLIKIIAGEKVYSGVITFDRLSALTKRKINSCEDAVSILGGKQINVGLTGITSSNGNISDISFENITQITLSGIGKPSQTTQTWNEQTTNNETIINLSTDILFDFDKTIIKPNAVPTLIRLARLIRQSKGIIQLNGFTDSKGTDEYNLDLSERRAESVKQWLVSKGGINAERLQTKGYGESQPVAPNTKQNGLDNPNGRQKNRRVEVRIPRN